MEVNNIEDRSKPFLNSSSSILDICSFCGTKAPRLRHEFFEAPDGETHFVGIDNYHRSIYQCTSCNHFYMDSNFDLDKLYTEGNYSDKTYGDMLSHRFKTITEYPYEQSDNKQRVNRVMSFLQKVFGNNHPRCLDVGGGIGVFGYELSKNTNWPISIIEPDPSLSRFIKSQNFASVFNSSFDDFTENGAIFDFISLNKVLEHVKNPIKMLQQTKKFLNPNNGIIYIELPDGEEAFSNSPLREEFFIEHFHAFSFTSASILLDKSGFKPLVQKRLKEPSGKYTIFSFGSLCPN